MSFFKTFRGREISNDGDAVTLKRFKGEFETSPHATSEWLAENQDKVGKGAVLDVETTGLDRNFDDVIEIGIRCFTYLRETGELLTIDQGISQLQDPGRPLSEEIKRLTGIQDEDLRGQSISWNEIDEVLRPLDLIIAHNARFDRPFVERSSQVAREKVWSCSLAQIAWLDKGFPAQRLEILALFHGFFVDSHRALQDADALLHLLSMKCRLTQRSYLNELTRAIHEPLVRVLAVHSPFESKDLLKKRGYQWDVSQRVWHKTLPRSAMDEEKTWMQSYIYKGECHALFRELSSRELFRE